MDIKGTNFKAEFKTVVKNIRLVKEKTEQIEGKIEVQVIVILTKNVRKENKDYGYLKRHFTCFFSITDLFFSVKILQEKRLLLIRVYKPE